MPKSKRQAICHPELPARGNGLCVKCYMRIRYIEKKAEIKAKTKAALAADPERRKRNYAQQRRWLAKHPEKPLLYGVKHAYGLSAQEYKSLIEQSGGLCAICGQERKLHVDHCHSSGRVRGLLCGNCNKAIGLLGDDATRASAATAYLNRNSWGIACP